MCSVSLSRRTLKNEMGKHVDDESIVSLTKDYENYLLDNSKS